MIWPKKIDGFCYTEFVDYINRIKEYAGKPDENIVGGFSTGCCVGSGKRYHFNGLPRGASPMEEGICDDCKFISRKQMEKDLSKVKKDMKQSVKEGYVNIEGLPYTACSYRAEWWYDRKDTELIPATLDIISKSPHTFNIEIHGEVQKKNVLDLNLRLGIDFIYSDDTFTSDITFSSKQPGKVDIKVDDISKYPEMAIFSRLFDRGCRQINEIMNDEKLMKGMEQAVTEEVRNKNDTLEMIMRKNKWINNIAIKGFYELAECDDV